jgi:hypothetical protein
MAPSEPGRGSGEGQALGHDRLDTTCRYYLGLDLRAAKEAHHEFLKYD